MSSMSLFLEGIWAIGQLTIGPIPLEAFPDTNSRGHVLLDFLELGMGGVILLHPTAGAVLLSLIDQVVHGRAWDAADNTVPESVKARHELPTLGTHMSFTTA